MKTFLNITAIVLVLLWTIWNFTPISNYYNLFLRGCDGDIIDDGAKVYYHDNGNFSSLMNIKDCYMDGFNYEFYDNGNIKSISYIKNDYKQNGIFAKEGLWQYFSTKGILYKTELYNNDKLIETTLYDTLNLKILEKKQFKIE